MISKTLSRPFGVALLAGLLGASALTAETPPYLLPATTLGGETKSLSIVDPAVRQASDCASCGALPPDYLPPRPGDDGCGGGCVAGGHCKPCVADTWCGRLNCMFYNALCCSDPCYEPHFVAAANGAMFLDGARPQNQTRLRWDAGHNLTLPDRNEYFWGRVGGKGPAVAPRRLNYHQLSMINEFGADKFSGFVVTPFRAYKGDDPDTNGSGMGDIQIGTKSLLLDTEIVQISLQFTTYIAAGNAREGAGTGHTSLEPALLTSIKLHEDTYLQTQFGEWIPIAGDDVVGGALFDYRFALSHVMCRPWTESQLIGTLEATGLFFHDGGFTDPATGLVRSSGGENYLSIGPGVRWVLSRNCDFGFGAQFAVTKNHLAEQLYRTEMRFRF